MASNNFEPSTIYVVQTTDGKHLQGGYPYSLEEMAQIASPSGDVFVTMIGGEVDWISTNEPRGQYILTGVDRNGDFQWKFNGDGNTVFIGSVFTFGFLANREEGGSTSYEAITWQEFDQHRSNAHVNFMGHESTAKMVDMEMQRISIKAYPGDTIVWAQYDGPRLEEGSTTLPEGARLVPMKAVVDKTTTPKNHYGDRTCYYNGVFECTGCGECNDSLTTQKGENIEMGFKKEVI